jgi:hypothetical protein
VSANRYRVRAELTDRLRRFEWDLARDEQAQAARKLLRGKTHDLLNFVQIVDLGSQALAPHTLPAGDEFIADLRHAAGDARVSLRELQALASVEDRAPAHTEVASCARVAIAMAGDAVDALDAQLLVADGVAVGWTREELELALIAVALDGNRDEQVELLVRTRELDGRPSLEIVCGPLDEHGLGVRLVTALAARVGGDAVVSERRGGGHELAVDIPIVPLV